MCSGMVSGLLRSFMPSGSGKVVRHISRTSKPVTPSLLDGGAGCVKRICCPVALPEWDSGLPLGVLVAAGSIALG